MSYTVTISAIKKLVLCCIFATCCLSFADWFNNDIILQPTTSGPAMGPDPEFCSHRDGTPKPESEWIPIPGNMDPNFDPGDFFIRGRLVYQDDNGNMQGADSVRLILQMDYKGTWISVHNFHSDHCGFFDEKIDAALTAPRNFRLIAVAGNGKVRVMTPDNHGTPNKEWGFIMHTENNFQAGLMDVGVRQPTRLDDAEALNVYNTNMRAWRWTASNSGNLYVLDRLNVRYPNDVTKYRNGELFVAPNWDAWDEKKQTLLFARHVLEDIATMPGFSCNGGCDIWCDESAPTAYVLGFAQWFTTSVITDYNKISGLPPIAVDDWESLGQCGTATPTYGKIGYFAAYLNDLADKNQDDHPQHGGADKAMIGRLPILWVIASYEPWNELDFIFGLSYSVQIFDAELAETTADVGYFWP